MSISKSPLKFSKEFTRQEPIPSDGVTRAIELLSSGRLHRYNTAIDEDSEVALLELEFANYIGALYCVAVNSGGSAIYVALKCVGVKPDEVVLCNSFTLAPVPGAIENACARCILIDIKADFTIDLNDLERKSIKHNAKYLLVSHMRGHVANMKKVQEICQKNKICLIEDCAHTIGCKWDGQMVGTFGKVASFSTQSYKHLNSGEGGLLVTNDEDIAAKAILYSGSYMHYNRHIARPNVNVFNKYLDTIPNYSLRMSNLQAAVLRPQIRTLEDRCHRWNSLYNLLAKELGDVPYVRTPKRDKREFYVGSSLQFTLVNMTKQEAAKFIDTCNERGLAIQWFGRKKPHGYTSTYSNWQFLGKIAPLKNTNQYMEFLCDLRIPLTFSLEDCHKIAKIIREVLNTMFK